MRVPLVGKSYFERSVIASAQKTINLYAEINDKGAPVPVTYYPTPGTSLIATPDADKQAKARCTYRTSIGTAYVVIGPIVYSLQVNGALVFIGNIPDRPSQVYMADNGLAAVLVDGSGEGWAIDLITNDFGPIIDPSFYGGDFVVFLDTFFVFNRPATNQFYISLSEVDYAQLLGTGIADGTISAAGAGYGNGSYTAVPLTGGTGTGATADITVAGGAVTVVDINNMGIGYSVGDVLSASNTNLGGSGAGFTWTVSDNFLAFDPLDIAAKSGSADPIVAILTYHKELWLVGALTTEVWIGTGAADFYFQLVQGAYIDHGCIAPYSAASTDVIGYWLMQDRVGKNIVVAGSGYGISEISTPFLVNEFNGYITTNDAIGFIFQTVSHAFYALVFPQANKSWLYELKTKEWNEWAWTNAQGALERHRANCSMYFNEKNMIGDWETGKIYSLENDVYTDVSDDPANPTPIIRVKTFTHMMDNNDNRVVYNSFDADMEVGEQDPTIETEPLVSLSWSNDRGRTYGFNVMQSLGKGGEFLTTISWNRLGMARDRIFKVQWSAPVKTALNGGFVEIQPCRT